jgi:hypothetical protein
MAKAKRAREGRIQIEAGSGNVFEDLGLPDAKRWPTAHTPIS